MKARKVGIVILNFNGCDFLKYALEALLTAKTKVQFEVGIIDNGSQKEDAGRAEQYFQKFLSQGGKGFFIRSEKNLGFSGGNNVVMRRFLEDPDITHLCMLNSDVLVTDNWLEYLTDDDYDVAGPVTNATGNEQTIAVDYEVKLNSEAFDIVNAFSKYRHETYDDLHFESDILYFFNTVFSRRVVQAVGLLDERFYPGSFEDIDYCWRIKQAGFKQMVIRGCYVHHFGSGSFSKLEMPKRVEISNVNQKRLEEKWNTHWESDFWRMLQSCRQDISAFQNKAMDRRSSDLIFKGIKAAESLIKNWSSGIEWYQSEQFEKTILEKYNVLQESQKKLVQIDEPEPVAPVKHITKQYVQPEELCGRHLMYLVGKKVETKVYQHINSDIYEMLMNKKYQFKDQLYPTPPMTMISGKKMLKQAGKLLIKKIGLPVTEPPIISVGTSLETQNAHTSMSAEKITADMLEQLAKNEKKVAIHAPMFTKANERDGYIQRIKRIDEEIFEGYVRIYFLEDGKRSEKISIEKIDDKHYFICYNSQDARQRELVFQWVGMCGLMYVHSINRFMFDSVNVDMCQLLAQPNIKTIWDVHGSVPEEYEMYGNDVGRQIGDDVESFFYHHIDVIVVVNEAMKRHLLKKHGETSAQFIVLPIFNIDVRRYYERTADSRTKKERPTIVYAGGTQKWQNVALMQQIIRKTEDTCDYRMFVPDPAAFNAFWNEEMPSNVFVDSCSPEELNEEYRCCDYGFVLRDDSVVNYVACPTKMVEYIQFGIVPIMKSKQIGDFVELGMQYVDYQDFLDGKIPTEEERTILAKKNYSILETLQAEYVNGIQNLKRELILCKEEIA